MAVVAVISTRSRRPRTASPKAMRLSCSGSRGAKHSRPPWSRMPPKPATTRRPGAGQRGDVQAVAGVVAEVAQVDERRLAEVVVGQVRGGPTSAATTAWVHADSDESRTVSRS